LPCVKDQIKTKMENSTEEEDGDFERGGANEQVSSTRAHDSPLYPHSQCLETWCLYSHAQPTPSMTRGPGSTWPMLCVNRWVNEEDKVKRFHGKWHVVHNSRFNS
jgi:hypothetical protein